MAKFSGGHHHVLSEEDEAQQTDWRILGRLLGYVRPYRKFVILAIFFNVAVSALGPLRPYLVKLAVDDAITTGQYDSLAHYTGLILLTLLIQAAVMYALTYLTVYIGQRIIHDLRTRLFSHAIRLHTRFFDRTPVGKVVTRMTNDVDALNELFNTGLVMIASDLMLLVWLTIFMFIVNWRLALVLLAIVPPLLWVSFLFRKRARDAFRAVRHSVSALNGFMQEHLTGMAVVQLFAREDRERGRFATINAELRDANLRTILYYAIYFPTVELLGALTVGLLLWYGGLRLIAGSMQLGEFLAFVQFSNMFFRPIYDLSDKYNLLQAAMAASERIFGLLDRRDAVPEPPAPRQPETFRGAVEFRDVTFSYNPGEPVLRAVSFRIEPGQTVAVVGATGAGKSTLINLLSRFYDVDSGAVLVDDVDVREWPVAALREKVAVVLQDVFLFSGSIRDNIAMDAPLPREQIAAAARMVGADRFIDALPEGYDSVLGERGASLSVGQRQLLSFARALAADPGILVMDEATSSVDTETEQLIQEATTRLLEGRTAIVIAHRLSTIRHADLILVLHHGQLRELGTHRELIAQGGIYHRLYELQYRD